MSPRRRSEGHRRQASRLEETDLLRPGELSLAGKSRAGPLLLEDRYESTSSLAHKLPIQVIEDNALIRKYKKLFPVLLQCALEPRPGCCLDYPSQWSWVTLHSKRLRPGWT
jgi:hypothetical protein